MYYNKAGVLYPIIHSTVRHAYFVQSYVITAMKHATRKLHILYPIIHAYFHAMVKCCSTSVALHYSPGAFSPSGTKQEVGGRAEKIALHNFNSFKPLILGLFVTLFIFVNEISSNLLTCFEVR